MLKLDTSGLETALKVVAASGKRTMAEWCNKAILQVLIGSKGFAGAMQLTPKASAAKIRMVEDKVIRGLIVSRMRKSGTLRGKSASDIDGMVKREKQRRATAAGYTAWIGWTPAVKALGGTGARGTGKTKMDAQQFAKSEARHGYAEKASQYNLTAIGANTAPMAEEIGEEALQKAIDNETQDLMDYAQKQLEKAAREAGF